MIATLFLVALLSAAEVGFASVTVGIAANRRNNIRRDDFRFHNMTTVNDFWRRLRDYHVLAVVVAIENETSTKKDLLSLTGRYEYVIKVVLANFRPVNS